jgi:hypothetical protein
MESAFQQKTTEDGELERRRAELAALRARHADARAVLQQLRDEIARFEHDYNQTLGRRMAELEAIEAEISFLSGFANSKNCGSHHYQSTYSETEDDSWRDGSTPARRGRVWKSGAQDIKSLYREVAKEIHPDLAGTGSLKRDRNELMSKANRAYAEEDHRTLQQILYNWRRTHKLGDGSDADDELSRVNRQIAHERHELRVVNTEVEELKGSYACRFKLRLDANQEEGNDLFGEMIAVAEINIGRARRRLALLKGRPTQEPQQKREKETKALTFSTEFSCGLVYVRDLSSVDFSQWKALGQARGTLRVDMDKGVRLDVKDQAGIKLRHLQQLKSNDLQSLFIYDICDEDLDSIVHLTGLEELYLSGPKLTDSALIGISAFINLKRIYIYQTNISDAGLVYLQRLPSLRGLTSSGNSITEEGLAGFERAIPTVKTVSFNWKR